MEMLIVWTSINMLIKTYPTLHFQFSIDNQGQAIMKVKNINYLRYSQGSIKNKEIKCKNRRVCQRLKKRNK